jgi:(2Fe-2S) ferredoxin
MLNQAPYRVHVCCGPSCTQFNPKDLLKALEEEIAAQGLEDQVSIQLSACRNRCEQSPSMNVYPGPVFYNRLTPDAVRAIVRQHLTGGEPVKEWLFHPGMKPTVPSRGGMPAQSSVATRPPEQKKRRWWGS